MDLRLTDRVILVTGGAGAIGSALVDELLAEGARVVVGDLAERKEGAQLRSAATAHPSNLRVLPLDLRDDRSITDFAAQAVAAFGRVDGLVNNAAVFAFAPLASWNGVAPLDEHLAVGVRGPLLLVKEIWKLCPAARGGAIVNVSSIAGHVGEPDALAYTPIKAAQKGMTLGLALEMAPFGGWSITVSPGHTWTPVHEARARSAGLSRRDYEARSSNVRSTLIGRFLEPREVATWIMLALSPHGRVLNGQDLWVTAGIEAGGFNRDYVTNPGLRGT